MYNSSFQSAESGKDLKIILVGNVSTGKTSIIERYIHNKFQQKIKATLSPNFSYKLINKNNVNYRLQFWDIPGQDRSPSLTSVFCRDAHGFVFCCDTLVKKTRNDILIWKNNLENFMDISNIPTIIMENKCDLLGDESMYENDIDELNNFTKENNFTGAFRTSALNGYNIDKAMDFLIEAIIKKMKEDNKNNINKNNNNIKLQQVKKIKLNKDVRDKDKKCC